MHLGEDLLDLSVIVDERPLGRRFPLAILDGLIHCVHRVRSLRDALHSTDIDLLQLVHGVRLVLRN